jgi:hypothetical protein
MDEYGRERYSGENLDEQDEIFLLKDRFRV